MNLNRINIVLGFLLAVSAAFAVGMKADHTVPNVEFLPEMKRSPAFAAFSANPTLPAGRTLQPKVAGTIPRGDLPLYYEATKEDAVRAGEELQNPYTVDALPASDASPVDETVGEAAPVGASDTAESAHAASPPVPVDPKAKLNASIECGAQTYGVFCISCHGPTGAGDGPVTKRGFPPPPPLTTGKSVQMKDGQLFHILTYGQGSMSSMAAQLDRSRRWDVINYVRSMQQGAAQSQSAAPTPASEPAATPLAEEPGRSDETKDEQKKENGDAVEGKL